MTENERREPDRERGPDRHGADDRAQDGVQHDGVQHDGAHRDGAQHHGASVLDRPRERLPARRLALLVGIPVVVLIAIGVLGRIDTDRAADATVALTDMTPTVAVQRAKREKGSVEVSLPGQTEAFDVASLYARATGYVAERRVDIGSRVRKGELLLRISAPDTDAQLAQAQAQVGQLQAALLQAQTSLKQANANHELAVVTSRRSTTLAKEGWTPFQTADNDSANKKVQSQSVASAQAGIAVAEANLQAQLATVQRLQALVGFERIVAPFDGVITERNVDVGDLLQADTTSSGTPLFTEASDDVLRANVYVPQSEAIGIRDGIEASVTLPELPKRVFKATVSRSAMAITDASRSMQTQIDIPNGQHLLRPGLYINIAFSVPRPHPVVSIPDAAVIFNGDGLQVAIVENGRAKMRNVTIEHDLGTVAELSDGLQGGEEVIVSPPADLVDGEKVNVPGQKPHVEQVSQRHPEGSGPPPA